MNAVLIIRAGINCISLTIFFNAQMVQVEGIVLQRFGRECCRIFRLLALKGHLEQKQVIF